MAVLPKMGKVDFTIKPKTEGKGLEDLIMLLFPLYLPGKTSFM